MAQSNWVHLDVALIKRATDKALLCVLEDGGEHWIPFSQMADPDDYGEGDTDCTISVSEFIAREKGLMP